MPALRSTPTSPLGCGVEPECGDNRQRGESSVQRVLDAPRSLAVDDLEAIGPAPKRAVDLVHHLRDRLCRPAAHADRRGPAAPPRRARWCPGCSRLRAALRTASASCFWPRAAPEVVLAARGRDALHLDAIAAAAARLDDDAALVAKRADDDLAADGPRPGDSGPILSFTGCKSPRYAAVKNTNRGFRLQLRGPASAGPRYSTRGLEARRVTVIARSRSPTHWRSRVKVHVLLLVASARAGAGPDRVATVADGQCDRSPVANDAEPLLPTLTLMPAGLDVMRSPLRPVAVTVSVAVVDVP